MLLKAGVRNSALICRMLGWDSKSELQCSVIPRTQVASFLPSLELELRMRISRVSPFLKLVLVAFLIPVLSQGMLAAVQGELKQWHTIEILLESQDEYSETGTPNPFVDLEMEVEVQHESGKVSRLVGFFAADGNSANTSATKGRIWKARFSPGLKGKWQYVARLRKIDSRKPISEVSGLFTVEASDKVRPDFRSEGHLSYVGQRYLQFNGSKRFFLKAGVDSPETLLGYHDFDGTWRDLEEHPVPAPHDPIELPHLDEGLHRYAPHLADWKQGDPTWKGGKGKGIVGGLNYLSEQGVNSVYFLTMNVNGDGRNVWPWIGPWQHDRFDCSKLAQWEVVFEHMQRKGLCMHVVLQETENDHMLDEGKLGESRKLYLRELVARFSHHPAIVWNLGEENVQTPVQQSEMAEYIRSIDPNDHPIVVHNDHWSPRNLRDTFAPHFGTDTLDGTSMQDFNWNDVHAQTKYFLSASRRAGKQWVVYADEMGGAQFGLKTDAQDPDHFDPRSKGLWGNLMAGGAGVEWYFGWQNNSPDSDLSAESWRTRENMYRQSKAAIQFFEEYLPFEEMKSADHLGLAYADYGFAKAGEVYCIYLFDGGNTRLNLEDHDGPFEVHWFDPREGGELQRGTVRYVWGPSWVNLGEPPQDPDDSDAMDRDWVALIRKVAPVFDASVESNSTLVAIEAENFESQELDEDRRWYRLEKSGELPDLEGVGNPLTWVRSNLSASKTASGETFVRILPDTRQTHDDELIQGANFAPEPGKMAVINYRVNFPKAGRYYVWVRAFSLGTEDNGVHVGLDGAWPESGKRMQWNDGKNRWTWNCAQRTSKVHTGVPMQIYLDIDSPGVRTVSFSMREDGFAMDKFLMTTDVNYRPNGEGPPEVLVSIETPNRD